MTPKVIQSPFIGKLWWRVGNQSKFCNKIGIRCGIGILPSFVFVSPFILVYKKVLLLFACIKTKCHIFVSIWLSHFIPIYCTLLRMQQKPQSYGDAVMGRYGCFDPCPFPTVDPQSLNPTMIMMIKQFWNFMETMWLELSVTNHKFHTWLHCHTNSESELVPCYILVDSFGTMQNWDMYWIIWHTFSLSNFVFSVGICIHTYI